MRYVELCENSNSNLGKFDLAKAFEELKKHKDESFATISVTFAVPRKIDLMKLKDFFYKISNHYKVKNDIAYHEKFYANEFELDLSGSVLRLKMAVKTYIEQVEKLQQKKK